MKRSLITYLIILLPAILYGQFSFLDDPYSDVEISFLRKKIEIQPEQSFFNVIKIKNPTSRRLQFNATISIPKGWTLMMKRNSVITLQPNDSILIPIRASASRFAKGEIGYAVVASLIDNKGKSFKNVYSFVNIPKKTHIQIKPENRVYYINNSLKKTTVHLNVLNEGNIDELIYLEFKYDKGIKHRKGINQEFKTEFLLKTNKDSTLSFDFTLDNNKNNLNKRNFRVQIKAYTKDTVINTGLWIKKIKQNFTNYIPDRNRMLIVELGVMNLFSDYTPTYSANIHGGILTRKAGDIFYSFQTMGSNFLSDPYKYSRFLLNYNYKNIRINAGDIGENIEQTLYGRGGSIRFKHKNQSIKVIGTKNIFSNQLQYGTILKLQNKSKQRLEIGALYSKNEELGRHNYLGMLGVGASFLKHFNFSIRGGISQLFFTKYNQYSQYGFGGSINIGAKFKKLIIRSNLYGGNRKYTGYYAGRIASNSIATYNLSNRIFISLDNSIYSNNLPVYQFDKLIKTGLYNTSQTRLQMSYILSNKISIYNGLMLETRTSNNFYNYDKNYLFKAPTSSVYSGIKIRSKDSPTTLNFKIQAGLTTASYNKKATLLKPINDNYLNFVFSANVQSTNWGIFTTYLHGPYTLNQHYSYVYSNYYSQSIRLLPQLNYFIYKDIVEIRNRSTIMYDITAGSTRINLGTDFIAYPGKGWEITFVNTIGYQASTDKVTDEKFKYNSTYYELRIGKKFGFNQPRIKYYDINIVFFKDLNGNGIKDKDEPGIENVLAKIDNNSNTMDSSMDINNEGGFYSVELLSNIHGIITYKNIPAGPYKAKYISLGTIQGNFTSDKSEIDFVVNKNKTIYVPFKENNKLYGSIIMNRSKLSNLGKISPANIKVTATDSKGNTYSTLTDQDGNFVIYVPDVDKYKISINNIFYEHFNLEQNNFEVQLNGYRQFEINFILNEKVRRINFSNNLDLSSLTKTVVVVKRTNVAGWVKDAATLKPIKAEIKIVNDKTGLEVAKTNSDSKLGKFFISFLAENDLKLIISADGYWYYSEKLPNSQITTFQNIERKILLNYVTLGSKVDLKNITFKQNDATLTPEAMAELDRLAKMLNDNQNIQLEIIGHCDNVEALDNSKIGEERAKNVMKYLMEKNVANLKYSNAANKNPIAQGNSEEDNTKNRRVEAIVISK